ncbi:phosphatase [Spelaeicoccus albus]|uniref:Taurine ABC transporter ATPase n=1 Tax=Spelaeicoccus albus TaxID=1280376 RepID=A0A7Z0D412_9MICO|nr:phosphatase [Spelaeicoccus albus]NYI68487.1 hypothetical protein [Spelaeicoccus albus]
MNKAQLAEYLDSARITGEVATPRENNLDHFQGFIDGVDTLAFGVDWKRDWTYDEVFDLMHEKVGTSADRSLHSGQDTISSALCVAALERFADRLGLAATRGEHVLFATGHPGGLLPVHAALAAALGEAGGKIVRIDEGFRFGDGDIRQISGVVMWHQHGHLMHTHLPGPMDLTLARLAAGGEGAPDLVVADHGWAGFAASAGIDTIGFADCNDPGLFVSEAQGDMDVAVPLDDNVSPGLYDPMVDYLLDRAGLS